MLLAVAGLDAHAVAERTQRLASGDWSSFSPGERAAFAFARKQARTPWEIGKTETAELIRQFGTERALDVIWWACRCHYMTRVADGFQFSTFKLVSFINIPQGSVRGSKYPC